MKNEFAKELYIKSKSITKKISIMKLLTVSTWLNSLKEPYRSQALKNMADNRRACLVPSLKAALIEGFIWEDTDQGHDYWHGIAIGLDNYIIGVTQMINMQLFGQSFSINVVGVSNNRFAIRVSYTDKCVETGDLKQFYGRDWLLSEHPTRDEIVKTCYMAFNQVVTHEIMEGFRYKNDRIFNPHHTVSDLMSI